MKKSRLFIDVGFTSILTCILFSLLVSLIYPLITKEHLLIDNGFTIAWFFLVAYLPVMLLVAPLHFVFLKLGELAGPLLTIILATVIVSVIRVDLMFHELFSPFLLITPIFCTLSWLVYLFINKFQPGERDIAM
ncbi:hypothetical protein [Alkalicoccobacillus porphyridii]|uniref:Uncharacterized protein n=1 Tax=Alkalicoccobacillus porphyridii TaxID=2597270 RepID=A0A553ZW69_9BACI|nr:hypothetical protein [Alkalicoccobacillus porphyridii]TSB45711.1 hypothetical protein FN960_14585 [Alkalicoccobacillus porphyridii]